MLVITRKTDESIIIGDDIEITVLDISRDRVKLGIDAPKSVKIVRNEIYMTEEINKQASDMISKEIMNKLLKGKE